MNDVVLQSPFDALSRTFIVPEQPQQADRVHDDTVRGHAFSFGSFQLLVDTARHPCEVYEDLPFCRIPGSSAHLVGMANQRGNIVPVFDLHKMLGYQDESKRNYYLIIGARDDTIGFRITNLPRRVVLASDERISTSLPIPHLLEPHIRQFYQQNEQIYADWNVRSFLDTIASGI